MGSGDIFILKPLRSNDHTLFFSKSLESLVDLLAFLRSTAENAEGGSKPYVLQKASPHFGICIKLYLYAGTHIFNYQQSLKPQYFDKSLEPQYGEICRKMDYN